MQISYEKKNTLRKHIQKKCHLHSFKHIWTGRHWNGGLWNLKNQIKRIKHNTLTKYLKSFIRIIIVSPPPSYLSLKGFIITINNHTCYQNPSLTETKTWTGSHTISENDCSNKSTDSSLVCWLNPHTWTLLWLQWLILTPSTGATSPSASLLISIGRHALTLSPSPSSTASSSSSSCSSSS